MAAMNRSRRSTVSPYVSRLAILPAGRTIGLDTPSSRVPPHRSCLQRYVARALYPYLTDLQQPLDGR